MRIATLAVSLVLSVLTLAQVAAAHTARLRENREDPIADGMGFAVALLYALGGMFSLARPGPATGLFVLAGLGGVLGGLALGVDGLTVWGVLASAPAGMSATEIPRARQESRPDGS